MNLPIRHACALIRVQTKVDEDGPIDLVSRSKPSVRLVGEAVLEVINADRA